VVLHQKRNQDCVFWSGASGCEVYEQRPRQCSSYPLWRAVVHAREKWQAESRSCPGIDRGDLHPESEITQTAATDGIPLDRTRSRLREP
jgi:Fe-S-cluster containining protein